MRVVLLAVFLLGCSGVAVQQTALDVPDGAIVATQPDGGCDPLGTGADCPQPDGGPPMICQSSGICGTQCGNGNVSCDDTGMICAMVGDCLPPCVDMTGAVIYRAIKGGACESHGLMTAQDKRCFIPCDFDLCGLLGGSC